MSPQPPIPSWCLLLDEHDPDCIDFDYAAKQSLLTLDLPCESNQAWGFDDEFDLDGYGIDIRSMMRHAKIQARVADPPILSYLTLTLRRDEKEKGIRVLPVIHTIDNNLLLFGYDFPQKAGGVHVIYNTTTKHLLMIPTLPRPFELAHTTQILIARHHHSSDDDDYSLVLMGKMFVEEKGKSVVVGGSEYYEPMFRKQDALFLCPSKPSSSSSPWKLTKKAILPDQWLANKGGFAAELTFTLDGHAFWADLMLGVLFCRCSDILSDEVGAVEFDYIDLPPVNFMPYFSMLVEAKAYRTIGRVGNTIKFIAARFRGCVKHGVPEITVWRLELGEKIWVKELVLNLNQKYLQNLPRDMAAMYPMLSSREENVVYFMLGEYNVSVDWVVIPTAVRHCLRVDILTGNVLSSAEFPSAHNFYPIIVASDFTRYLGTDVLSSDPAAASVKKNLM